MVLCVYYFENDIHFEQQDIMNMRAEDYFNKIYVAEDNKDKIYQEQYRNIKNNIILSSQVSKKKSNRSRIL